MECPSVVSQKVCVEAKVTVEPEAKIGHVHACCLGKPLFDKCGEKHSGCTYMVSQMLCVHFPLTISASASAKPAGIVCCRPKVEPCDTNDESCFEQMSSAPALSRCEPMPLIEGTGETERFEERERVSQTFDLHQTQHRKKKPMIRRCGFCFPTLCFPLSGILGACGFVTKKHRGRPRWLV